jgi:hypothetical protein
MAFSPDPPDALGKRPRCPRALAAYRVASAEPVEGFHGLLFGMITEK